MAESGLVIRVSAVVATAIAQLEALQKTLSSIGTEMTQAFEAGATAASGNADKIVAANKNAADSFAQIGTAAKGAAEATTGAMATLSGDVEKASGSWAGLGKAAEGATATIKTAAEGAEGAVAAEAAAFKKANDEIVASTAAMRKELEGSMAGVKTAEAAAITSTEKVGTTMAGTAEGMGVMAVASSTAKSKFSDMAGAVGLSGKQLLIAGGAAAIVGGESVKMAGDFQSSTQRLVSSAGEIDANLDKVRQGILQLAGQVGVSAEDLSAAMYKIESGGQHGADGLNVLKAAAQGAKTENADLTVTADAVTSALTDYHLSADQSATVMSKLVAATGQGKMTFQELASSMSSILPVASANHVSLDEILGDLASMTSHGISAQQASQNLADTIGHMTGAFQTQGKEFAMLGLNAQQLSQQLGSQGLTSVLNTIQGAIEKNINKTMPGASAVVLNLKTALQQLPPAVQDLGAKLLDGSISMKDYNKAAKELDPISSKQATSFATLAGSTHQLGMTQQSGVAVTQSYAQAMMKATGDQASFRTSLMLTGENLDKTKSSIQAVASANTEADGSVKGWSGIQETFNQKMSEAKAGLGALGIQIGSVLLPVVSQIAGAFAAAARWMSEHKAVAIALAVVIGVVLAVAIAGIIVWMYTFAASIVAVEVAGAPLILIVLAIIAVIAILVAAAILIINHWGAIKQFFVDLWDKVKSAFTTAVDWCGKKITEFIAFVKAIPANIGHALSELGSMIATGVKNAVNFLVDPFKKAWDQVVAFFSQSPNKILHDIGEFLGHLVGLMVVGMVKFAVAVYEGLEAVHKWFDELPGKILSALAAAGEWLLQKGRDMVMGLLHGIETAAAAVWSWLKALPGKIWAALGDALQWLVQKGKDILTGLQHGIVTAAEAVWAWMKAVPGHILEFFKSAPGWLLQAGKDILQGLWDGLKSMVGGVLSFVGGFISGFMDTVKKGLGVSSPSTLTHQAGVDTMLGLQNGVQQGQTDVTTTVANVPKDMVKQFATSKEMLIQPGKDMMAGLQQGLDDGMKIIITDLQKFGQTIAQTIEQAVNPANVAFTQFTKTLTEFDVQLKAGISQWIQFTKEFALFAVQVKAVTANWTTFVKNFTTFDTQLKQATATWITFVKNFTLFDTQVKAVSALWTKFEKDFTLFGVQLKILSALWTKFTKDFVTFSVALKAVSALWVAFVKNFVLFDAQLKIVSQLWAQFVIQFTRFVQLLHQAQIALVTFVKQFQLLVPLIKLLVTQMVALVQQMTQLNQSLTATAQAMQLADDTTVQWTTDLGTTVRQLQELGKQLADVTLGLIDMEQWETAATQEFSWMRIEANQAGEALKKAMEQGTEAVKKLDEEVKKVTEDLKKLIELMQQAGLSGGGGQQGGGGGTGGAAASGAATANAAVGGANGALQSASPSMVMNAVGQNFSAGFEQGIAAGTPAATTAATTMAQSSVDTVNSTLQTASPSAVMHRIGRWLCEGFWRGILEELHHCREAAQTVVTVVKEVFTATSSLNAQYNTGQLYAKSLADGIVSNVNMVKAAAGTLATAANNESLGILGRMGLLGKAGSGAQVIEPTQVVTPLARAAMASGGRHCTHEHRLYIDGCEIRNMTDHQIRKALDELTDAYSRQKR